MVNFQVSALILGAVAIQGAYASAIDEDWPIKLLKRQQPGTPAYNCHDNCGQAIIASRGSTPCNDKVFTTDYKVCLSCAGPDNYNIWQYYGRTLSIAAGKCNLPTTPASGKQPDPPVALTAPGGEGITGPPGGNASQPRSEPASTEAASPSPEPASQTPQAPSQTAVPVTSLAASGAPANPSPSETAGPAPVTQTPATSGSDSAAPPAQTTAGNATVRKPDFCRAYPPARVNGRR